MHYPAGEGFGDGEVELISDGDIYTIGEREGDGDRDRDDDEDVDGHEESDSD